jgi:transcriptional/translational regulatory protein YebC/TACO1
MEYALEAGAEDVRDEDGVIIIETAPNDMISVKDFFTEKGITEFITSEVSMVAESTIELDDDAQAKLDRLIDALEDSDDVQDIYTNAK